MAGAAAYLSVPLKAFTRTAITQSSFAYRRQAEICLQAMRQAYIRLGIVTPEHELKNKSDQMQLLQGGIDEATKFRVERFQGLLEAMFFHEVFSNQDLSVSGGVEHGYDRMLYKLSKLPLATRVQICKEWNEDGSFRFIPAVLYGGNSILTMLNEVPTTTLYKNSPFIGKYILVVDPKKDSPAETEIKATMPNATVYHGDDTAELAEVYYNALEPLVTATRARVDKVNWELQEFALPLRAAACPIESTVFMGTEPSLDIESPEQVW